VRLRCVNKDREGVIAIVEVRDGRAIGKLMRREEVWRENFNVKVASGRPGEFVRHHAVPSIAFASGIARSSA
jgi:hypothetical protein